MMNDWENGISQKTRFSSPSGVVSKWVSVLSGPVAVDAGERAAAGARPVVVKE